MEYILNLLIPDIYESELYTFLSVKYVVFKTWSVRPARRNENKTLLTFTSIWISVSIFEIVCVYSGMKISENVFSICVNVISFKYMLFAMNNGWISWTENAWKVDFYCLAHPTLW
jgi:hypothetical protein